MYGRDLDDDEAATSLGTACQVACETLVALVVRKARIHRRKHDAIVELERTDTAPGKHQRVVHGASYQKVLLRI